MFGLRWKHTAAACLVVSARGIALTATWADERTMAQRFEAAKRDEPSLIAFLKRMPKGGDLHLHPGGALYAETALDDALRRGLFFDPATGQFDMKDGPGRVPAAKLLEGEADNSLSQFLDAASMRGYRPGTESGHDHFFRSFDILGSADEGLTAADVLGEIIARARAQNEQYLELMGGAAAPGAMGKVLQDAPPVDNPEKALAILQPKLDAFVTASRAHLDTLDRNLARRLNVPAPITGTGGPVTVRYQLAASRLAPDNLFFASLAAGMALMQADKRVVAVNILAPEDHPFARTHFETQMRLLDALWKHFGHPNISLHAGELTLAISPVEAMFSRIRRSIEAGHARRIGHGVSIAWEDDLPGLLRKMRTQGIAVEICLTSNDGILGVRGDRHPFDLYRRAGVPVTLNTDDEGVNRSNLTMEYVRAVRTYRLSYPEVKRLVRNSLEYSFLPGESLYVNRDYRRLRAPFANLLRRDWKPSAAENRLLASSAKLRVQARLERAFVAFEK